LDDLPADGRNVAGSAARQAFWIPPQPF